jgi:hypothetical protein
MNEPTDLRLVPGFPGYGVTADAKVWTRQRPSRLQAGEKDRIGDTWREKKVNCHTGYPSVILCRNCEYTRFHVKSLMRLVGFLALAALSLVTPARADDYAFTAYAWESPRNAAFQSHTFATFDRLQNGVLAERVCISWGPDRKPLAPPGLMVSVRGRNRSLEETLASAKQARLAVYAAGPYPCLPDLFFRAKGRVAQLQSGRWRYVLMDGGHDRYAVNCIGAVLSLFPNPPRTGTLHGRAATEAVVKHFGNYLR